jgi:hypothetical protein
MRTGLTSFGDYLKDIVGNWIGFISGMVSVSLWALGAWVESVPLALRWTCLILSPLALFIACFTAWLKRMPRLTGSIDQAILGQFFVDPSATGVFISMIIRNTGLPSLVDGWRIYAQLTNGRRVDGRNEWIERTWLAEGFGPTILVHSKTETSPVSEISADDALYKKGMTPIPTGGEIRGQLAATFPGVTQADLSASGAKIVVEFMDVWHRRYSCAHVVIESAVPRGQTDSSPTG